MNGFVYLLCAATALVSALLLLRTHRRTGVRLLHRSALFFLTLVIENVISFVDLVIVPEIDLGFVRSAVALSGVTVFVYSLICEID